MLFVRSLARTSRTSVKSSSWLTLGLRLTLRAYSGLTLSGLSLLWSRTIAAGVWHEQEPPTKKRSVSHGTFNKWKAELDKGYNTMSWLECETVFVALQL